MEPPFWPPLLQALETELAALLSERERAELFRRAGRRAGRTAADGKSLATAVRATECLPLGIDSEGFPFLPPDLHHHSAWIAACQGFLEGADPEGSEYRPEPLADGRLRFTPSGPRGTEARKPGLELPETGPLTPYQLAQVVDLSVDAILFIDAENRIRAWNWGAERMFGYSAEEALGRYFDLLVPEDLAASGELEELARRTVKEGRVVHYVTRRRTRDGREIKVSLSRSLVRDTENHPIGAAVVLRDISAAERLEKELAAARHLAEIGELAAQIAHEVRNPLAGIHGALQILRRREHPPEEEEVFDAVTAEIRRIDHLVTDLKRFARGAHPHRRRIELGAWAEEWAANLRKAGNRIEVQATEGVRADTDPRLLATVLQELLENTMEATEGSGVIRLQVGGNRTLAWLVYQDDGPGLPKDLGREALRPFVTTKTRGSGLGLAICQRTLQALGGRLEILESKQGAAFRIRLPRCS